MSYYAGMYVKARANIRMNHVTNVYIIGPIERI